VKGWAAGVGLWRGCEVSGDLLGAYPELTAFLTSGGEVFALERSGSGRGGGGAYCPPQPLKDAARPPFSTSSSEGWTPL